MLLVTILYKFNNDWKRPLEGGGSSPLKLTTPPNKMLVTLAQQLPPPPNHSQFSRKHKILQKTLVNIKFKASLIPVVFLPELIVFKIYLHVSDNGFDEVK